MSAVELTVPLYFAGILRYDPRNPAWPERDRFMRGLRAWSGFRQTGVPYVRPERMFGRSTNNLLKNIDWAKKGIFSFSNTPLTMLTSAGVVLLGLSARQVHLSRLTIQVVDFVLLVETRRRQL